jgi:periplasmic mercuric ion binding protein
MKLLKHLILMAALACSSHVFSQEKNKKETIVIRTSAQCEMCKDRIEKALAYTKGVKKSNLDVDSKLITVIYNAAKISPEKIREAISKAGYDADSVAADPKAYESLPGCCKKGGME